MPRLKKGMVMARALTIPLTEIVGGSPEARMREPYFTYDKPVPKSPEDWLKIPRVLLLDYGEDWQNRFDMYPDRLGLSVPSRYYLLDGNHRTGTARSQGKYTIRAWVVNKEELFAIYHMGRLPWGFSALDSLISCNGKPYDRTGYSSC